MSTDPVALTPPVPGGGRRLVGAFGTVEGMRHVRPTVPTSEGSSRPRVSVVIPCYCYGHYLEACIDSALDQPGVDVDALILDDASPDGSGLVAEAIAAQHQNVRVVRHRTNAGHLATYNEGLGLADGDFVVLLSADDLLTPGALARATAVFSAFPSVGLVHGRALILRGSGPPDPPDLEPTGWTVWPGRRWLDLVISKAFNCVHEPTVVMRTDVLQAIGGYHPPRSSRR